MDKRKVEKVLQGILGTGGPQPWSRNLFKTKQAMIGCQLLTVCFSLSWPFLRKGHTAEYAKVVIILWSSLTTQPNEGDSSTILRLQGSPNPHPDGPSWPYQPLCVPACGDMCEQHVQLERCNSKILCRLGPSTLMLGLEAVRVGPVVPPSREEKGLTEQVSSGCIRTKHWAVSREPSASCLISAWTTAVASPCSPSFYRAPPIWAACLPQPEQSFQTINQIT